MDTSSAKEGGELLKVAVRNVRSCSSLFRTVADTNISAAHRQSTAEELLCHVEHVTKNMDMLKQIVQKNCAELLTLDLNSNRISLLESTANGVQKEETATASQT